MTELAQKPLAVRCLEHRLMQVQADLEAYQREASDAESRASNRREMAGYAEQEAVDLKAAIEKLSA